MRRHFNTCDLQVQCNRVTAGQAECICLFPSLQILRAKIKEAASKRFSAGKIQKKRFTKHNVYCSTYNSKRRINRNGTARESQKRHRDRCRRDGVIICRYASRIIEALRTFARFKHACGHLLYDQCDRRTRIQNTPRSVGNTVFCTRRSSKCDRCLKTKCGGRKHSAATSDTLQTNRSRRGKPGRIQSSRPSVLSGGSGTANVDEGSSGDEVPSEKKSIPPLRRSENTD